MTDSSPPERDDPLPRQFLSFLAHDIASHPEHLLAIDASFVRHIRTLTAGIEVDINTALSADDE